MTLWIFLGVMYLLSACCTYHGKSLSQKTADQMKALGYDVQCLNDEKKNTDPKDIEFEANRGNQ